MPHPSEHSPAFRPLEPDEAVELVETLKALASESRFRILAVLVEAPRSVEDLAAAIGLSQSATSHQLRILRSARLVRVRRTGRHAHYELHNHHVRDLFAAIRHHHEHVHPPTPLAVPEPASEPVADEPS